MTRYRLKNSGWKYLSRKEFIKAVVEKYVSENTNKSFEELNQKFSGIHESMGNNGRAPAGVIKKTTDARYTDYPNEYKIIGQRLDDGTEIAVYDRGSYENEISRFLEIVTEMDYQYETDESPDSQEHNNSIGGNNVSNLPLNQILYGPPGTGKTYDTINKALEIINNEFFKENEIKDNDTIEQKSDKRESLVNKFNELRKEGRIEFVTFHQNYSYEDFIEGIKPDVKSDSLKFIKKTGIFKKISETALKNLEDSKKTPEQIRKSYSFSQAIENLKDKIDNNDERVNINETAYFLSKPDEQDAFRYTAENWDGSEFRMKHSDLIKFYDSNVQNRQDIKRLDNVSGLAKQHATYYFKTFEIIKNMMSEDTPISEPTKEQNYVIIIDEINRANISRVFGELITLIEDDKRWGNKNQMELTLPSRSDDENETFKVPKNLYIIGTMNTADKSIALLDIALRRRFKFIPMYPKYELIEDTNLKDILKEMNMAIKEKKGTDFMIGHSFFINKKFENLENLVNNDLLPLISEYFNNKEKDIKKIFKEAGITVKENEQTFQLEFKDDSELNPATENNESN